MPRSSAESSAMTAAAISTLARERAAIAREIAVLEALGEAEHECVALWAGRCTKAVGESRDDLVREAVGRLSVHQRMADDAAGELAELRSLAAEYETLAETLRARAAASSSIPS
ncbi:MAG: hypothetical protein ABJE47_04840 [bacterium]